MITTNSSISAVTLIAWYSNAELLFGRESIVNSYVLEVRTPVLLPHPAACSVWEKMESTERAAGCGIVFWMDPLRAST